MKKCTKCGEFIDSNFDICYDCKNSPDADITKKVQKELSKKTSTKKITHLLIYPFVLTMIFGITANPNVGFENIELIVGYGFGQFLIGYYPVKLIMLFANRFKHNKWEWPIGYKYYIIPLILYFWINLYVPNL